MKKSLGPDKAVAGQLGDEGEEGKAKWNGVEKDKSARSDTICMLDTARQRSPGEGHMRSHRSVDCFIVQLSLDLICQSAIRHSESSPNKASLEALFCVAA